MSKQVKALRFATIAHAGQKRRYTGEDYIVHPIEVSNIILQNSSSQITIELLCATFLHDTVEDTEATLQDIKDFFGTEVHNLVYHLTDISKLSDGNRATRKAMDREHIAKGCHQAKTIKLADLISNSRSIIKQDPNFAKVYMKEKKLLLDVLKDGDAALYKIASDIVNRYKG